MPERRRRPAHTRRYQPPYGWRGDLSSDKPKRYSVASWEPNPVDPRRLPVLVRREVEEYPRGAYERRLGKAKKLQRGLVLQGLWQRVEQVTDFAGSMLDIALDFGGDQIPDDLKHIHPRFLANALNAVVNTSAYIRRTVFSRHPDEVKQEVAELKIRKRYLT